MQKSLLTIEIVRTSDLFLSSMSVVSAEAILRVLKKEYKNVKIVEINNLVDLEALIYRRPDLVFLGLKYIKINSSIGLNNKKKVWISEVLDKANILYTGSSRGAHELERNKPLAKWNIKGSGLKTADFIVINKMANFCDSDIKLSYPLFIKPTKLGGGLGVDTKSLVRNFNQLKLKVKSITHSHNSDSLVEEYLSGREFSVAIIKSKSSADYLKFPIELLAPDSGQNVRILSSEVKSADAEKAIIITDLNLKKIINDLALACFNSLGGRDYGRIDIRLDSQGTPNFLEANLIPSLISGYGSFPKACLLNSGIDHPTIIKTIVDLAFERTNTVIGPINLLYADRLNLVTDFSVAS
jgi:D-alanine-D-alanine ligase